MTPADTQSLKDAVARSGPAVLSLPVDGALRHHRTRFLMPEDQDGFWVEAPQGQRPLIDELLAGKKLVGVSLKAGDHKVVFTTVIREFESGLPVANNTATVDAVLLAWPDQVQAVQRRNDYRVSVEPNDADLHLRVWRIADHHLLRDKPPASALIKVGLRDLSVGGMGLVYTPDPDPSAPRVVPDQRLRIAISHGRGEELILDGRVRHARTLPAENYRLGVQFKKHEDDFDGRQALAALTQIVGQLQRTEIRRKRLELSRKSA